MLGWDVSAVTDMSKAFKYKSTWCLVGSVTELSHDYTGKRGKPEGHVFVSCGR